jgi:hypothetical protein
VGEVKGVDAALLPQLSAATVLHALVMQGLTAAQRCLVLPAQGHLVSLPLVMGVPAFCRALQVALAGLPVALMAEAHPDWHCNEIDALDARLLQALLLQLCARGTSPAALAKALGVDALLPDAGLTAVLEVAGCAEAWTKSVPAAAAAKAALEAAAADAKHMTAASILNAPAMAALAPLHKDDISAALFQGGIQALQGQENEAYVAQHLAEDDSLNAYGWHRGAFYKDKDIYRNLEEEVSSDSLASRKQDADRKHQDHRRRQILIARMQRLRAPIRTTDADPILDEMETLLTPGYAESMRRLRRIGDLGNLIMLFPRWQTKLNPQRMEDKSASAVQRYAESLIGGPVQTTVITKDSADVQSTRDRINTFALNLDLQTQTLAKRVEALTKLLKAPPKDRDVFQEELGKLKMDPGKSKKVWDDTLPDEMGVRGLAERGSQAAVAVISKVDAEGGFPERLRAFRARIDSHLMRLTYLRWRAVHEQADARTQAAAADARMRRELGQDDDSDESSSEDEEEGGEKKASGGTGGHAEASPGETPEQRFAREAEAFLVVPEEDVRRAQVVDEILALLDLHAGVLVPDDYVGVLERLAWLGFAAEAEELLQQAKAENHVGQEKGLGDDQYALPQSETLLRFQLRCMGPYLGRPKGVRDAR